MTNLSKVPYILIAVLLVVGLWAIATEQYIGDAGEEQVCVDYLFAGRAAPDLSPGFYVERIICLTPEGVMEPIEHPSDLPGLQATNEALIMELLATQRLAQFRLDELNKAIESGIIKRYYPPIYINEEN